MDGPPPLHLTKVAFGAASTDALDAALARHAAQGTLFLTTRNLPKRHAEIADAAGRRGSLYWIIKHQLVARSPILGFGEADGGRVKIIIAPRLVRVIPRPKRAHQGWRYLEHADAPVDVGGGAEGAADLPAALAGDLSALGLI